MGSPRGGREFRHSFRFCGLETKEEQVWSGNGDSSMSSNGQPGQESSRDHPVRGKACEALGNRPRRMG